MTETALFVYGTLRRPVGGPPADTHFHERIVEGILASAPATLSNCALYDLGSYPGLGRGNGVAIGECFDVSPSTLRITDLIEGHPDFYVRQVETVVFADGETREAWVYWAPEYLLADAATIESGDWFKRPRGVVESTPIEHQLAHDMALEQRKSMG